MPLYPLGRRRGFFVRRGAKAIENFSPRDEKEQAASGAAGENACVLLKMAVQCRKTKRGAAADGGRHDMNDGRFSVRPEMLQTRLARRTPGLMDSKGKFAVLVPLIEREDGLYLLYEVRCHTMRRQPGEICFPGGGLEGAESVVDCALRETREELGIAPEEVRVLGELDFIALRFGATMHPVLGLVNGAVLEHMTLNPDEVAETFLVPLDDLREHPAREYVCALRPELPEDFPYEEYGIPRDYPWMPGRESIPFYVWEDRVIWGLTARTTRCLLKLIDGDA